MGYHQEPGILTVATLLLMGVAFRLVNAGDFALVADLDNGSIYAGSMGQALADLARLPLRGVRRPVAVDYDPVEKMVYWSDLQSLPSPKISRAHLNGSNQVTLFKNLSHPDGLALDVDSRMMYWTDGTLGRIARASMDGTTGHDVIVDNLDQPRTIAIDHRRGHIYWTDWGNSPRIERADLDGSHRITIVEDGLHWPNGVTIDSEGNVLYWCDAFFDKIERSDLLGNNRQNITIFPGIHPFDLAVYKGNVYWTDWAVHTVLRVSSRGEERVGPAVFRKAGGIHIQEEPDYCGSFPCSNGATCVDVINGFSCRCPPGFHGPTCTNDPCSSEPCVNGGACGNEPGGFSCQCPAGYDGPTCELIAGCVLTPDPSSLLFVTSDQQAVYLPGDPVEYDCPDGYQLTGSAKRNCQSNFTWSGQPSKCILNHLKESRKGGVPVAPIAGLVVGFILFLVVLAVVFFVIRRRRKTRKYGERIIYIPDTECLTSQEDRGCSA